jgi:DNA-binding transcriptional LysR family regulator
MDLKSLEAFSMITELGSLTRAAAALGIAQSVLSRRISSLEVELGGRLFHRTGRGVVPTDLGQRLAVRARNVIVEADALLDEARGAQASPAGIVDIAFVPAVARPLLTQLLTRLRSEFPRIRLRAQESYSGQIEELLANGQVDIGVFNRYSRGNVSGGELIVTSDIAVVAPRAHYTIRGAEIPFRSLQGLQFVLPPMPNPLVAAARDLAQKHRFELDVVLEAASATLTRSAVTHSGLCSLAPLHLAQREYGSADVTVARIVKPSITQRTWLVVTAHRPASLATRTVLRIAHELSRDFLERATREARQPGGRGERLAAARTR